MRREVESDPRVPLRHARAHSVTARTPRMLNVASRAGNRAVVALIQRSPAPTVQRDVGLELEVQHTFLGRYPKTTEATAPTVTAESPATQTEPELLPYGEKVAEGEGFHIESDTGRLEVVTKAFGEDEAGREGLVATVTAAATFLNTAYGRAGAPPHAVSVGDVTSSSDMTATEPDALVHGRAASGARFGVDPESMWAKPQASAGIRLDRLAALAKVMHEARITGRPPAPSAIDSPDTSGERDWGEGASGWYSDTKHRQERMPPTTGPLWTPSVHGFLDLLVLHLVEADNTDQRASVYAKSGHSVMPRTSFATTAKRLEKDLAAITADSSWWVATVAEEAGRELQDLVYPMGYYDDSTISDELTEKLVASHRASASAEDVLNVEGEAAPHLRQGPSVHDFLTTVFAPIDVTGSVPAPTMEGRIAPSLPGSNSQRGLGALHKEDQLATTMAPVFEIRTFEAPYGPEHWPGLAHAVHETVCEINRE